MLNNQFHSICETINSGIIILNSNLEVKFWNRWLEVQTKIKAEDISEKKITEFYPTINKKILSRKIKTALKLKSSTFYNSEQTKYLLDIRLNKITDSVFYNMQQSITISPFDEEKELVIIYVYDTTSLSQINYKHEKAKNELEKKNEQLKEKNKEFERMLNALTEGILIFDEELNCININDFGLELLAYENKEEVMGKHILEFVAPKYRELAESNIKEGKRRTYEIDLLRKDGTTFPSFSSGKTIQLDNKKRRVSTIIDISILKEKDRLIARQAKLADMGQMIANIAHQWRQPLNLISTTISGLQLYKDLGKMSDKFFAESVEQILYTTNHLSQTIDDFKNFIKDDKEKRVFSLLDIIQKDLSLLEGIIKSHHIEVKIKEPKKDIILKGYPNELIQAIVNIISNSKDALNDLNSDDKKIFIEMDEEKNYATLKIYDNAGGIKNDIIDKIFQPYFTTKHKSQGTGLGLFMTHRIIQDSMEGSIEVSNIEFERENTKYKGACFLIKLPLYM